MFIYFKRQEQGCGKALSVSRIEEGDFFFFLIEAEKNCKKRKILKADRLCGTHYPVASSEPFLPPQMARRLLSTEKFIDFLLVNTFCEVALGQKSALLFDPDGRYAPYLLRLLSVTQTLYILSPCPIYEELSEGALGAIGVSPIFLKSTELRSFSVALGGGRAKIVLGEGGFMPFCDTVFAARRQENFILAAAKFEILGSKSFPRFLPEKLKNKSLSASPAELKKMLDTF